MKKHLEGCNCPSCVNYRINHNTTPWISVNDSLPTGFWGDKYKYISEEVLVANTAGIDIAFYNRAYGGWYTGEPAHPEWIDKIRYWMPLPDPPDKQEE